MSEIFLIAGIVYDSNKDSYLKVQRPSSRGIFGYHSDM